MNFVKINTIHQNIWEAANTVLRGKFIALKSYIRTKKVLKFMIKLVPKDAKERPIKPNVKYRKKHNKVKHRN